MKKILHAIALVAILSISAFAQPAQNVVTMQNAATATGNGTAIKTASQTTNAMFGAVGFQITGTFSATVTFEVTFDGSTWVEVMATNLSDDTRATTATAAGAYSVLLNGALQCRARISAYTSGSITVKGRLIPGLVSRVIQAGGGGGGSGDVVGPGSATDNAVARFNTTTGKLIQNSVVTVGDTGDVAGIAALTFTGVLTGGSAPTTITDSAGKILSAALNTVQPAQGGTGITALGTGIAAALGVNIGSPGAPVLFNGAGGTPSSLTLTNATGLPPTTGISGWPANAAGVLTNNGSGTLSWGAAGGGITIGTTTITSGTATRLLYETSGNVVGEISGATSDGTTVTLTSPTVNTGITLNAAPLTMSGNISAAAWTTSGIRIKGTAATLTDTTSSGTVAAAYTNNLGGNTIAASSSTTYTDYYQTFITQPTAGTNVTFTRRWALGLNGGLEVTVPMTTGNGSSFTSSTVTSGNVLSVTATGTAAASNTKTALSVATSGANGTSSQTTFGAKISNTSTGTSSKNIGASFIASGGSTNIPAIFGETSNTGSSSSTAWFDVVGNFTRLFFDRTGNEINLQGDGITLGSGSALYFDNSAIPSGSYAGALARLSNTAIRLTNGSTGAGNLLIGTSAGAIGTSGAGVLAFTLSTAPTTSPTDTVQLYSADSAAGAHNLFSRNELGEVNRLTGLAARNSSSFAKTSDTTLANITGLSRNVEASRTYAFTAVLQSTAAATGGVKFSVSGTATATAISYEGILMNGAAVVAQTRATALDTAVCASTTSTAGTCTIRGVIQVNAAGTLTVQFAQNASDGSASTVLANQYFQLIPIS